MVTVAFDGGTSNGSSKLMVEVKGGGGCGGVVGDNSGDLDISGEYAHFRLLFLVACACIQMRRSTRIRARTCVRLTTHAVCCTTLSTQVREQDCGRHAGGRDVCVPFAGYTRSLSKAGRCCRLCSSRGLWYVGKPHCLRAHYGAHTGGCISTAASTQPGGHTSADLVTASLFSFLSFIFYVFNMQGSQLCCKFHRFCYLVFNHLPPDYDSSL